MNRWLPLVFACGLVACHHHAAHGDHPLGHDAGLTGLRVEVTQHDDRDPECIEEVLGVVDAHVAARDEDHALELLRRRGQELGADQIIDVEYHHAGEPGTPQHLSGMAVRCNDLIGDRPVEVIGTVHAEAPMGREHDAYLSLKRRARALGADFVVDVDFEHGHGANASTRLVGTAVRLRPGG